MGRRVIDFWPRIPANNGTIVLFATHDRQAGGTGAIYKGMSGAKGINPVDIDGFEITWHRHNKASAANGLRLYVIDDTGAWRESDLKDSTGVASIGSAAAIQIAALGAGEEQNEFFVLSRYRGFAFEYTAGADNPEEWNGTMVIHIGATAVQR